MLAHLDKQAGIGTVTWTSHRWVLSTASYPSYQILNKNQNLV